MLGNFYYILYQISCFLSVVIALLGCSCFFLEKFADADTGCHYYSTVRILLLQCTPLNDGGIIHVCVYCCSLPRYAMKRMDHNHKHPSLQSPTTNQNNNNSGNAYLKWKLENSFLCDILCISFQFHLKFHVTNDRVIALLLQYRWQHRSSFARFCSVIFIL